MTYCVGLLLESGIVGVSRGGGMEALDVSVSVAQQ